LDDAVHYRVDADTEIIGSIHIWLFVAGMRTPVDFLIADATCIAHDKMWPNQLKALAWILAPPAILLLALNKAVLVYRSYATRVLATVLVAASAVTVIVTVKISNPSLAFMTGLLEGWMVIWSTVLLIHYNPLVDARRRRWRKVSKLDGESEYCGQTWQRYPAHDWMCRLEWTTDLLLNFRGIGWKLGRKGECSNRKVPEYEQPPTG
jgi:hypothetical protein